jgi:hypothetical protein
MTEAQRNGSGSPKRPAATVDRDEAVPVPRHGANTLAVGRDDRVAPEMAGLEGVLQTIVKVAAYLGSPFYGVG